MKTITEQTIKFVANDGEIFDSEDLCLMHEQRLSNLYDDTISALGNKKDSVLFVNFGENYTTLDDFLECAKDIWYDAGYGSAEIRNNILIVGENWWLERAEYDGSEWWEYKELPVKNGNNRAITKQDII